SPVPFREYPMFSDIEKQESLQRMVASTLGQAGFPYFVAFDCDEGNFLAMSARPIPRPTAAMLSVETEILKDSYFTTGRWSVWPTRRDRYANSLFKPTFRGVEDTF